MDNMSYIQSYLKESMSVKQDLMNNTGVLARIDEAATMVINAYRGNNKVLLAGNGGSAADSQHIAAEFVSRFFYDRPGLPALALTTDSSMLTAIGNDYGFVNLFSRQVQAQGGRRRLRAPPPQRAPPPAARQKSPQGAIGKRRKPKSKQQ